MDQWKTDNFSKSVSFAKDLASSASPQPLPAPSSNLHAERRQRLAVEAQDPNAARKVQKADREKLRRDRLNEQFQELGNTLDPDRPKNDKATILTDTIQMLKDLTSEVNRLKTECAALSEESHELALEKNELREEKASLKSDIENINTQYQQRVRVMFPWTAIDHSVVMGPPYSYPVPVSVPPGSIPLHPAMQAFPFFGNQNPGSMPDPCSAYVPYLAPANPLTKQPSTEYASTTHFLSKQDPKNKSPDHQRARNGERCDDSNDVATELELKMPGSSVPQDSSSGGNKAKHPQRQERNISDGSTSSRYSSSQVPQDSSSNSVGDKPED
ncbi:transcription factor bHLH [Quillaja saponaria]|uniref:Transcription factor bHLH n=1 Tax=Quillaja saponaria TaxID=32244 RepID=A0AAD7KR90_QUISA|nr:transcription factor bHLH [Quillaja saponaria]